MKKCDFCRENSWTTKSCSRCHSQSYCSKSCQRSDWKDHKKLCRQSNDLAGADTRSKPDGGISGGNNGRGGRVRHNPALSERKIPKERAVCNWCQKVCNEALRCSRCRVTRYCSQSCQRKDWLDGHQKSCQPLEPESEGGRLGSNHEEADTGTTTHPGSDALNGEHPLCQWCQKAVESPLTCSKCQKAVYCSRSCQRNDWKSEHKMACTSHGAMESGPSDGRTKTESVQYCSWCQNALSSPLRCSRCKKAAYCSKACQEEDWKAGHKSACKGVAQTGRRQDGIPAEHAASRDTSRNSSRDTSRNSSRDTSRNTSQDTSRDLGDCASSRDPNDISEDRDSESPIEKAQACTLCKRHRKPLKSCARCKEVSYCSKACQTADWARHKPECVSIDGVIKTKQYNKKKTEDAADQRSAERRPRADLLNPDATDYLKLLMGIVPGVEMEGVRPKMPWSEAWGLVQLMYPGHTIVEKFEDLPGQVLWLTPVTRGRVLLANISRMHPYQARHSVYIQDAEGNETVVMFYVNYDIPTPFFSWRQLRPGNYICLENAVFHNFMDGTVGIRIDEPSDVKII